MVKEIHIERIYTSVIKRHLANYQQMIFLSGPRQAGKTTVSLMAREFTNLSGSSKNNPGRSPDCRRPCGIEPVD